MVISVSPHRLPFPLPAKKARLAAMWMMEKQENIKVASAIYTKIFTLAEYTSG